MVAEEKKASEPPRQRTAPEGRKLRFDRAHAAIAKPLRMRLENPPETRASD